MLCNDVHMTDATLEKVAATRRRYDQAQKRADAIHAELLEAIRDALEAGHGPAAIGREANWTREYIAKIRDNKVKGA